VGYAVANDSVYYLGQVNEYPRGVGLSPHIDTHSAFEGSIMSLSLSGPCVMEFRRYLNVPEDLEESPGYEVGQTSIAGSAPASSPNQSSEIRVERKRIFLPERSLLILSNEARYAWHHYIPHHKVPVFHPRILTFLV
jgi:alkylated DNA repair protein alkB family protein 8